MTKQCVKQVIVCLGHYASGQHLHDLSEILLGMEYKGMLVRQQLDWHLQGSQAENVGQGGI